MKNTSPQTQPRTTRRVAPTLSYGPTLRIADWFAGRHDRRMIDAGSPTGGPVSTPYIARLQATYDENDRRTYARTQDACRQPATKLRELITDLRRLDELIGEAESGLAHIPAAPSPEALAERNGGEIHLDDEAVATRRRREHAVRVAQAQAVVQKLRDERNRHLVECARHAARLVEEFELGRSVSERMRHCYNRRMANYARHAHIPGSLTPTIIEPAWAAQPCPWVPAGYHLQGLDEPAKPRGTTGHDQPVHERAGLAQSQWLSPAIRLQ